MLMCPRFTTVWRIRAPKEVVHRALSDVEGYKQWWPGTVDSGPDWVEMETPFGRTFRSHHVVIQRTDSVIGIRIIGALPGWCTWRMVSDGDDTVVTFMEQVRYPSRLRRLLSIPTIPLTAAHIRKVMRDGELGLQEFLARTASEDA